MSHPENRLKRYKSFVLALIVYTFLIILWGAWVRISGSGDGCGDHWPLCQGQILPEFEQYKTLIEFAHRLKSGLYGLLIIGMYFWARKLFQKGHTGRAVALASLIFTITEGLLGAALVKFSLVGTNDSLVRAFSMSLHMINSLLLTGSLTLTWLFARTDSMHWRPEKENLRKWAGLLILLILIIATTGAFASLAVTLFPSESLEGGIIADFSADSHPLIRLRILHPILALVIGSSLGLVIAYSLSSVEAVVKKRAQILLGLLVTEILFGLTTLFSLAPVWMKLVHLQLAHLVWMSLLATLAATLLAPKKN
ncbi:MAG: COX15/CtaA family protein [Pseudobdellovibrionaceae bacterium]